MVVINNPARQWGGEGLSEPPMQQLALPSVTARPSPTGRWRRSATGVVHLLHGRRKVLRLLVFARGWPCLSVKAVRIVDPTGASPALTGVVRVNSKIVPLYLPIWDGLLLNTLLYGFLTFALHSSWRACVSRRRRRAWQCPKCGYDRRGLAADAVCPECGAVSSPAHA